MRVDQPFRLADGGPGRTHWPERRLRGLIGKGERYDQPAGALPVHLTYFTTSVDERGAVHTLADLYGIDRRVRPRSAWAADRFAGAQSRPLFLSRLFRVECVAAFAATR